MSTISSAMDPRRLDHRALSWASKSPRQTLTSRATRESWPYREEKSRGRRPRRVYRLEDLPADIQAAVIKKMNQQAAERPAPSTPSVPGPSPSVPVPASVPSPQALWEDYATRTDKQKNRAKAALAVLLRSMELEEGGLPRSDAQTQAAKEHKTSPRTLQRHYKKVEGVPRPDWLPVLAPGYVAPSNPAPFSPEAWEFFKADYLRREQPRFSSCYDRLLRAADANGWIVPSMGAVRRRLRREIPRAVEVMAREGKDAVKTLYPPQQRDKTVFHAMEAVNGDGWRAFHYCRFPDGAVAQPCVWIWQDVYSGKILAWRADQTENADMFRLAYGDLVETWGIPPHVYIDNTMAAANKWMTGRTPTRYRNKIKEDDPLGIMPQVGSTVHWTTPGHGQAKPVERCFSRQGGLAEIVDRHPALSGRGTKAKPLQIDEWLTLFEGEIRHYNAKTGRTAPACAGRSLDETFAESYAAATIAKATAEQRRLWLLAAEKVTAHAADGSIKLFSSPAGQNRYWCEALSQYAGQKLVVRFDPQNLHESVHAYTPDGRHIAEVPCLLAAGFNDTEAARKHNRARAQHRKATKAMLDAERRMTATEAAAEHLPPGEEPETPAPAAVAPRFAPPAPAAEAAAPPAPARAIGQDFGPDEWNEEQTETAFRRGLELLVAAREEEQETDW